MNRGFWIFLGAIAALLVIGFSASSSVSPAMQVFVPAILIDVALTEFATLVLIAVILRKFRYRGLLPLGLMFLSCALIDLTVFVTLKLPGTDAALLWPGNTATAWLFNVWHLVVPGCAVAYAGTRRSDRSLSRRTAERAVRVWLPVAVGAVAGAILLMIVVSYRLPSLVEGDILNLRRGTVVLTLDLAVNVIALAVCVRLLAGRRLTGIDGAALLTLVASIAALALAYAAVTRYDTAWTITHLISLCAVVSVLVAGIRELVDGASETLRIESDDLRTRALAFERNAAIEASLVKSRFVATVSHELRTPLGGIIGMAELLERTPLDERQKQFTAAIRSSADTLFRIVNDLLDFSRAESGRLDIEAQPYNLDQLVSDVVTVFRPQATRNAVALSAYVDPSLPTTVIGDQTRLKQVLQNLVGNALRFTAEGAVSIEVVGGSMSGEIPVLCFSVRDTGIGIPEHVQEAIFEPFVQADASTARRFGGTGLGLSIARHLIEMMGGRISLSSKVGQGSTFTFTIPYKPGSGAGERPSLSGVSVLVVEKSADARALFARCFEGWGMQHVVVASIAEARAAMAEAAGNERRFDLLVVGAGVPALEATEFVRSTRGDPRLGASAAILARDADERGTLHYPGFDACIGAPLRQSELFDTIVRLQGTGFAERVLPTIQGVPARAPRTERILVAEDNEVNQALLAAQLEHLGFAPDIVGDGKAAVEAASAQPYDLIFLDCQMPEVDGFEAARRIRSAWRRKRAPIIAVTANVLPGYRELCLAAGMSDYLAKPALIGPLSAVIDRWLPSTERAPAETATAPNGRDPNETNWPATTRRRLLEVFHGDEARVARVIATSLSSLREGKAALRVELSGRDVPAAAQTAHRLKGIALEMGLEALALSARSVETAIRAQDWDAADEAFGIFDAAIETVAATVEEERS
jgi:signal transduction histidine kinase/DNA-binding response OmpR family regulator